MRSGSSVNRSDLFFPLIAPRSLAECRVPTNARRPPPLDSDRANGSHVIDVGSATATTPGYRASRRDNSDNPVKVGGTTKRCIDTDPSAVVSRTDT